MLYEIFFRGRDSFRRRLTVPSLRHGDLQDADGSPGIGGSRVASGRWGNEEKDFLTRPTSGIVMG